MSQDGDGLQVDALDRPGPPPELREPPRRSRAIGAFLATFALAAFAGLVWYAYDRGLQAGSEATAPLIQADPSPVKVRPAQPGGLDIPNQDKLVYGALRPGEADSQGVERLLPPPEQPAVRPEPLPAPAQAPSPPPVSLPPASPQPAGPTSSETDSGAPQPTAGTSATVPIPPRTPKPLTTQAPSSAPAPPAPPPVVADVPPARVAEAAPPPPAAPTAPPQPAPAAQPEPRAAPTPAPTPAPYPAPASSGAFRIQLGAFRDEAAARQEWDRLKGRYPTVLSALSLRIQKVDLGPGKGVFHRIQGGMLTEDGAAAACAALKERNQPCLLVRP